MWPLETTENLRHSVSAMMGEIIISVNTKLVGSEFCISKRHLLCCLSAGGGQTVRPGRPDVRRVPGGTLRGQVCPLLLCQRHLSAVLLRILLGQHPLASRPRVSQATGEGRG